MKPKDCDCNQFELTGDHAYNCGRVTKAIAQETLEATPFIMRELEKSPDFWKLVNGPPLFDYGLQPLPGDTFDTLMMELDDCPGPLT